MKKILPLLYIFLLFASTGFCQDASIRVIHGIILNGATKEPVSYATIRLLHSSVNTMSNENGQFTFKIPAENINDSILITHIGFRPFVTWSSADTSRWVIHLKQSETELAEVVIKKINGLDLIKNAISKIPENYSTTPYRVSGFYRMTGKKEKRVIDLSEAVYDIRYESHSSKNSQFKLIKSRVDKDLTAFNGADNVSMGLSPEAVLNMDMVSNIKGSDLLNDKGLKEHQFYFKGMIDYNGHPAYEVLVDQKDGVKKALYKGKIILDADNLAFLEFDLGFSPKGLRYFDWGLVMKLLLNMSHIKAQVLADDKIITYRRYGGKYYLNYAHDNGQIYLAGGAHHFVLDPLFINVNFLITRIDTVNTQPFSKDEILRNKTVIESQSTVLNDTKDSPDRSDTSDRFWENYNLIQAEFRVDSAVRVIQANNKTLNYKEFVDKYLRRTKNEQEGLDALFNFYHEKELFSGTALVQQDGKTIYAKGFGWADKEKQIPNGLQTRFRIGSTSKQFTAMGILMLENEHKLSVMDTVGKYISGYANGQVTIQQLLTHQSGIPNYTSNPEYLVKIMKRKYSPDELVSLFCSDSLEFSPGKDFNYSNSGYVILADILQKVSGMKYADFLRERIFTPLGMKNSYFITGSDSLNLAKGYINEEPENPYPVENVIGAGGITSTAEDLQIWANALFTVQLLPTEKMNELFIPRVEWKEWQASYGYGWMIDRNLFQVSNKHTLQYHPGTEFGFFDMLLIQPDKKNVIILLNNTGDFPRFDMTDLILNEINR